MRPATSRLKFFSTIFFLLLISQTILSGIQSDKKNDSQKKEFSSLHKSLLLPGWGQLAEKRYFEGFAFLAGDIYSLYKVIQNNRRGNRYYRLYQEAANSNDAAKYRELTEKYDINRNRYLLISVGLWAVNLLDIYLIVKSKGKEKKILKLKIESEQNLFLAFSLRFSF